MAANNDQAVTPVLGTMLMMALFATLIPGAMLMMQEWQATQEAFNSAMSANREAAEKAAWCAQTGMCADFKPGYDCRAMGATMICTPKTPNANVTVVHQ